MHHELGRRAPAETRGVAIDLHGVGLGQEGVVLEVGTQEQQPVGLVGRLIAGPVAQQAAHPHVVRVVVLDPLPAAERVAHGAVYRSRGRRRPGHLPSWQCP